MIIWVSIHRCSVASALTHRRGNDFLRNGHWMSVSTVSKKECHYCNTSTHHFDTTVDPVRWQRQYVYKSLTHRALAVEDISFYFILVFLLTPIPCISKDLGYWTRQLPPPQPSNFRLWPALFSHFPISPFYKFYFWAFCFKRCFDFSSPFLSFYSLTLICALLESRISRPTLLTRNASSRSQRSTSNVSSARRRLSTTVSRAAASPFWVLNCTWESKNAALDRYSATSPRIFRVWRGGETGGRGGGGGGGIFLFINDTSLCFQSPKYQPIHCYVLRTKRNQNWPGLMVDVTTTALSMDLSLKKVSFEMFAPGRRWILYGARETML